MKEGNYAKWRGNKQGISKVQIQKQLAEEINKHGRKLGIERYRDKKSVGNKIDWFQTSFKNAHDLAYNTTGQGILSNDGPESFNAAVTQHFRYYFDLEDVMKDWASTKPPITSDDLDNDFQSPVQEVACQTSDNENSIVSDIGGGGGDSVAVEDIPVGTSISGIAGGGASISASQMTKRSTSSSKAKRQKTAARRNLKDSFDDLLAKLTTDGGKEQSPKAKEEDPVDHLEKVFKLFGAHRCMYKQLVDDGTSEKEMARTFPHTIRFSDFDATTTEEQEKYIARYNKWVKEEDLGKSALLSKDDL